MNILFVKRIFGVKVYGDDNWIERCTAQGLDPHEVFPATVRQDRILVKIGMYSFDSDLDNKTFLYVTPIKKDLKEYL